MKSCPRIEYSKRRFPNSTYNKTTQYILNTNTLNYWDTYSTFSEDSKPDSIS